MDVPVNTNNKRIEHMQYKAWFQCINEQCKERYPLNTIIYRCKACDSLLEVQHDMQCPGPPRCQSMDEAV